ncbi:MAG: cell division protein ZapA [Acinetobacter sp.]|jgi:cell division protein ZapA (FtsZ GTPase activity inhibitor)|nr:MAG: cell division protein ZapA [Acinetobacter sp.]
MSDLTTVELWLLDSTYKFGCPIEKQHDLKNAGSLLEQKFRDMRQSNPRMDNQKITVMVALQLMQEVLELNQSLQQYGPCEQLLSDMVSDIDQNVAQLLAQSN